MIIDAHHHLWDPRTRRHAWLDPLPALRRPFTLEAFTGLAAARGVAGSVLVTPCESTGCAPRAGHKPPAHPEGHNTDASHC